MAERHHSIGEVLSLLKEEHPDLTISKIRFFESQGLIAPDRTPSGYRKFADDDIERLRWILVQQRDHFLPLKVIKRRLDEGGFDPDAPPSPPDGPLPEPTLFSRKDETEPAPSETEDAEPEVDEPVTAENEEGPSGAAASGEPEPGDEADGAEAAADDEAGREEPVADDDAGGEEPDDATPVAAHPVVPTADPAPAIAEGDPLSTAPGSVSLTEAELAEASGMDRALIGDLERLGLIERVGGDDGAYDHEALVVAKAAAVFLARGVEPRHLRMYRVAADREAGLLEQLMGAKLRKGGDAAATARAELNELIALGEAIHRSIVRRSFGPHLG